MISKPDNKCNTLGGRALGQRKDDLVLSKTKCCGEVGIVEQPQAGEN